MTRLNDRFQRQLPNRPGRLPFHRIIECGNRNIKLSDKLLKMQKLSARWFATVEEAENLGLDVSELKTFHYRADVLGLASRKNPNQILLRYSNLLGISELQKVVFPAV